MRSTGIKPKIYAKPVRELGTIVAEASYRPLKGDVRIYKDITQIMENQEEKKLENDMQTEGNIRFSTNETLGNLVNVYRAVC